MSPLSLRKESITPRMAIRACKRGFALLVDPLPDVLIQELPGHPESTEVENVDWVAALLLAGEWPRARR